MAAALVVFFCLISSVLLAGVTSLKCQTCLATRGECRNEDMALTECEPDQTHCLSLTFFISLTTPSLRYTAKSCARAEECTDGFYSITSAQGKYSQVNFFCCQSDGCNTLPLLLPFRDELKPNGLVCSGSYTRHRDSHQPTQPIICLGQETRCVNMNLTINTFGAIQEEGWIQGCGTPNVCTYPDGEMRMANGLVVFSTTKECNTVPLSLDNSFLSM
ncbi:phospholipase A2 inhibitor and Ly6/PLAUR domain-containing protein-like [Pantherophis guttatus]|uniref:Phospholipase A2 inhibitor and Ly6/PLAUR domain-containing protein-like n=1 Tax=Pantherophis guttatus TaxID=94885 RepID=A0ABM3YPL6_PANGU|nr:phospholipase A2 inhibitor and Ly6/PLAUR domain-containing protein-like [Pantherophis guttatus]